MPTSLYVFQPWQLLPPQPPPLPTSGIPLVPVRPVTDQQMVWRGRESSKGRKCTTGPLGLASGMAQTLGAPDTLNPLRGAHSFGGRCYTSKFGGCVFKVETSPCNFCWAKGRGRGAGQSISCRAGANHQLFTVPWGVAEISPCPAPSVSARGCGQ